MSVMRAHGSLNLVLHSEVIHLTKSDKVVKLIQL